MTIESNQTVDFSFAYSETGEEDVEASHISDSYDASGNITGSLFLFTSKEIHPAGPFTNNTKLYVFQNSVDNSLFYVTVDYSSIPAVEGPEITNLTSQIEDYQKQIGNMSKKINSTKSQMKELNSTIDDLKGEINDLKKDKSNLTNENNKLTDKNDELTKKANNIVNNFMLPFLFGGIIGGLVVFALAMKKGVSLSRKAGGCSGSGDDLDDLLTEMVKEKKKERRDNGNGEESQQVSEDQKNKRMFRGKTRNKTPFYEIDIPRPVPLYYVSQTNSWVVGKEECLGITWKNFAS